MQLLKQLQQYQQSQTRRRLTGASGAELDLLFGWSEIKNQLVGADSVRQAAGKQSFRRETFASS